MSQPPAWTPKHGERHGDWKGETVSGSMVVWDHSPAEGVEHISRIAATSGGTAIDPTIDFVTVRSDADTNIATLPTPEVGKTLEGWAVQGGFELAASKQGELPVSINGVVCTNGNTASVPARSLWRATCVSDTEWVLVAHTELGAAVAAIVPS